MTPAEMIKALLDCNVRLMNKTKKFYDLSVDCAKKERDYRISATKAVTHLRMGGTAISLIGDMVRGDKDVSQSRYEYEIAKAAVKACSESIKTIRGEIDTYRSLLAWEKVERMNP